MVIEPLIEELSPPPDPWAVAQRFIGLPKLLWFDSAGGPSELARYSYIAASPFEWFEFRGQEMPNPFEVLREQLSRYRSASIPGLPPFQGGAAGLLGYDLCHWLERLPRAKVDEFSTPDLAVGFYDWVIAWDHYADRCWLISTGFPNRFEQARIQVKKIQSYLELSRTQPARPYSRPINPVMRHPLPDFPNVFSNFNRAGFLSTVDRAVEYTHAGDCFQVNIAQRLVTPLREEPLDLYGRLRKVNPASFAAYFDTGYFQILSASPERFLKLSHNRQIETRPIKGTRPRGRTEEEDRANIAELLASAKDRAENVMIVDLLRNDLGRVCEYGSVTVPAVCQLESHPTVHHLVSQVRGQLRPGLSAIDVLKAAFPGGSVTGAPKVRAMEIIAELEPHARGPYCGCLGWIGFDGAMDTNILIRTFTAGKGWLKFPVGGGIVADSVPEREYEETLHKAAGLLRALEVE
jgi:para-aminobenzoate synthetase component 1